MAIVVEEEKKQQPRIFNIVGWLGFLVIAAIAVYYIFFAAPAPAILPATGGLSALAPLTQSATQLQTVTNDPTLKGFHTTIAAPTSTGPAAKGRPNPFIAP